MIALLLSLACTSAPEEPVVPPPEPGELLVGTSRVRMPLPVGIGTVGYGGFGIAAEPSPFAEIYPATTRIHNHPDFRVVVVSRGDDFEQIWMRSDTVGIFQQLRRAVVLEVAERTGRDIDQALLIGATHTHSGPGRVIDAGGPFELIADRFLPEFYDNMVNAMADAIEAAYADMKPGRIGTTTADTSAVISDRRCEDGLDYVNGTSPVVAVEQEGIVKAVMLAVPIHGTVLGIDELTLSQDVSGGIEQAIEDRFTTPVMAMQFNSWGADMSPRGPEVPSQDGNELPDGYDEIDRAGQAAADAVDRAWDSLVWTETPIVELELHRRPIDRSVIGYDDGVFTYDYGGVYCGSGLDADCDLETNLDPILDDGCIPFTEAFPAPNQTNFSVGRLADLAIVTFPGEPGTLLAEKVMGEIAAVHDAENVVFLGYAQDYLGYAILEDDWWQGGYEASGALWGPRQGEYLSDQLVEVFADYQAGTRGSEPDPIAPFGEGDFEAWNPTTAIAPGVIAMEPPAVVRADAPISFTVHGLDPWLLAPTAVLIDATTDQPVTRPGGQPFDSDGTLFWVDLEPVPSYRDAPDASERTFLWTFTLSLTRSTVGVAPSLVGGSYRIDVTLPDGTTVTSSSFEVEG